MKVCTDSCIFGAAINVKDCTSILDIGTGTGLLALMAAQRCAASIDAVEIDKAAAQEAIENINQSPWANRIQVHATSIQLFKPENDKKYDLIISNPPFFSDSLKSTNGEKNTALHQAELSLAELLEVVKRLLKPDGRFVILLPSYEAEVLREEAMDEGLYSSAVLKIRDTEKGKIIREITEYRKELSFPSLSELIRKEEDGSYTPNFISLLKEYYLHL
jgi:tRNA1Val (adenine37-N6)-methyltransferase